MDVNEKKRKMQRWIVVLAPFCFAGIVTGVWLVGVWFLLTVCKIPVTSEVEGVLFALGILVPSIDVCMLGVSVLLGAYFLMQYLREKNLKRNI